MQAATHARESQQSVMGAARRGPQDTPSGPLQVALASFMQHGQGGVPSSKQGQPSPHPFAQRPDPQSLDMNLTPDVEPYAITALLTDDLLPIGFRREGREGGYEEGGIRQVSRDAEKPQVLSSFLPAYMRLMLMRIS